MNTDGQMQTGNYAALDGGTYIIQDGQAYLCYHPYNGLIARIPFLPLPGTNLRTGLEKEGFFQPPPDTVHPDTSFSGFNSLTLFMTRCCNLHCQYCYAWAGQNGENMPPELALDAVNWFAAQVTQPHLRITFHGGGEPTLRPDLIHEVVEQVEQIKGNRRTQFLITTNGTADLDLMKWMMAHHFGISVSMDGPPDIQDRNRPFIDGSPSSPVVEDNIRNLVAADYPFTIRLTYSPRDEIERIIHYFHHLGVRKIHLEPLFPFGRCYQCIKFGPGENETVWAPDATELANGFLTAIRICHLCGIKVVNSHLAHFTKGLGYFCGGACGRSMMVTHDGLLSGCLEVVDRNDRAMKTFKLGRWIPSAHSFAVGQHRISKLQQRHADKLPGCQKCFARYTCAGGCAVKSLRASGQLMSRDVSYCGFTRVMVPALIKNIAQLSGI